MQELTAAQYEYIGRYLTEHLRNGATIKGGKDCLKPAAGGKINGDLEIVYEHKIKWPMVEQILVQQIAIANMG